MFTHDVAVVGAGAAGLFCAGVAAQRGARVALIDHAPKLAEKIRISGGGRCNFTNVEGDRPERYVGERPGFHRAALKAYRPADFIALVQRYRIPFHEKHRGQLFCDESAEALIAMLRAECEAGGVHWWRPVQVEAVRRITVEGRDGFAVDTSGGEVRAAALVVATGGLSIPKIGATDLGYRLATQFGHRIVPTRPALVPLTFPAEAWAPFAALAGLSLPVRIRAGVHDARFDEDLLFTHRGLSGPAVLQISTFWRDGDALVVDLAPGRDVGEALVVHRLGGLGRLGVLQLNGDAVDLVVVVLARGAAKRRDAERHLGGVVLTDLRVTETERVNLGIGEFDGRERDRVLGLLATHRGGHAVRAEPFRVFDAEVLFHRIDGWTQSGQRN